jgi:hypothetical protein
VVLEARAREGSGEPLRQVQRPYLVAAGHRHQQAAADLDESTQLIQQ